MIVSVKKLNFVTNSILCSFLLNTISYTIHICVINMTNIFQTISNISKYRRSFGMFCLYSYIALKVRYFGDGNIFSDIYCKNLPCTFQMLIMIHYVVTKLQKILIHQSLIDILSFCLLKSTKLSRLFHLP